MPRLAIFDCDGTLVDSIAPIETAMAQAFASAGLAAPARADVRQVVGLSLPQAMAALLPAAGAAFHAQLSETYKQAFRDLRHNGAVEEPLFDGIAGTLDRLEQAGWLLGVATGKSDRGLHHCLEAHGLLDTFVTLQTADRHPSKPHPAMLEAALSDAAADPADSVMIGDTAYDMVMARAAGVRAIGVAWGYHPVEELRTAGADAIAQDMAELQALLA